MSDPIRTAIVATVTLQLLVWAAGCAVYVGGRNNLAQFPWSASTSASRSPNAITARDTPGQTQTAPHNEAEMHEALTGGGAAGSRSALDTAAAAGGATTTTSGPPANDGGTGPSVSIPVTPGG